MGPKEVSVQDRAEKKKRLITLDVKHEIIEKTIKVCVLWT